MTPEGFNCRSRVHEYGGTAAFVDGDLIVVSDFATGRLNRVTSPGELVPLTPERQWRYADVVHDAAHNRLIAVREDHEPDFVAAHGKPIGAVGPKGQVREVQLTSGGFHIVAAPKPSLPLDNPI